MGKADLHIHTNASDGKLPPEQILDKAKARGLQTISITDHDTIKGYLAARLKAEQMGITLIPGVEVSCIWNNREIHILAYNFDVEDSSVNQLLAQQSRARKKRMKAIVAHLQKKGVDIEYEEVLAEAFGGNIGRPHAAAILAKKGVVRSVPEAFVRYLGNAAISEIGTDYATLKTVLDTFKHAGGVLSVAHPGPLYSGRELREILAEGMDGIECIHPGHNYNKQKHYTDIAKSNYLLVTGGSDYHGTPGNGYDPYFGILTISEKHVAALLRLSENRRLIHKRYT